MTSMDCITDPRTELATYFKPFALKMETHNLPPIVINLFKCYFSQLLYGSQGKLTKKEILPIKESELKTLSQIKKYRPLGEKKLKKLVIFKLNGGLGTSMGLKIPKGLVKAKNNKNFIEIILEQVENLRSHYNIKLPLIFMNSFYTHQESSKYLPDDLNPAELPPSFVQHKYPRILKKDLTPVKYPANPNLEWNPPGHGDFYTALVTTKLLDTLLEKGYKYAFVSNCDNLGATIAPEILGYLVEEKLSFLMEVTKRTALDKKGGHLCRLLKNYRLALREVAQCPSNEQEEFQDINLYSFFNTNSLWLNLKKIREVFIRHKLMPLDLIINEKTLDPEDQNTPRVIQLETAIGSAISAFDGAEALVVPRTRFSPVKTTSDLLLIRSNCYLVDEQANIVVNQKQKCVPLIELDPQFYANFKDFEQRFTSPVKIENCSQIKVEGDFKFGENITFKGKVNLKNTTQQQVFLENKILEGEIIF